MFHFKDKLPPLLYSRFNVNPIFYLLHFLILSTTAGPVHGGGANDPSTYEAITGESADEDRSVWDSYYKNRDHTSGKEAVGFLRDNLHLVKRGRAFVPAMGEGRNAIYLAKKGFTVEGVDISEVAVDRALQDAKAQKVSIKGTVADLLEYKYPDEAFDFIVISQFYIDSLNSKFKKSLKKGGYILFYEKLDTGKPQKKASPDDFLVKAADLKKALQDFELKVVREYKDQKDDVIGILARKP